MRRFFKDDRGQDLIETTLLVAFVSVVSVALFLSTGGNVARIWNQASVVLAGNSASGTSGSSGSSGSGGSKHGGDGHGGNGHGGDGHGGNGFGGNGFGGN